ncbi:MAG TPA: preprotein translocase subunit SecG [Burkholderiales bacterium]|jgi:preprotein translocase subunit SecG|nr:preprotein translocase subunit SecG [Burkholderiales bacterium]
METVILILHVLAALCVIGLVLLQHGKGADMGAAFGSGSAGSLFGASGSANFLSRTTAVLAAAFFLTSLGLTYLTSHRGTGGGVMSTHQEAPADPARAIPAPTAPQAGTTDSKASTDSKANEVPK